MASSNACFYLVTRWFIKQTFPKRHATRVVTVVERATLIRMKAFLIDHSFSRTDKFSLSLGDDATTMGFTCTLRETEFLKKQFVL